MEEGEITQKKVPPFLNQLEKEEEEEEEEEEEQENAKKWFSSLFPKSIGDSFSLSLPFFVCCGTRQPLTIADNGIKNVCVWRVLVWKKEKKKV